MIQPVNSRLMETPLHIARNRIVGGDVALDFINTQTGPPNGPPDGDALLGYDDLILWARHVGELGDSEASALIHLGRRDPRAAAAVFDRAREVRSTLHAVFSASAHGETPRAAALAALRDAETEALEHATLAFRGDHLEWSWNEDRGLARPLWPIVHAAVELVTGARLERVKQCGGCRYLFVDASKNNSRRWCAMEDCGTAAKSKTFVARRRARKSTG
jgi:predicted RNA-binding Zn ribbon-like protein